MENKTETPPKTPTIAEIWGEFETMATTGNPCYIHSREGEQWEAMFQSLRQQLLERCEKVKDTFGNYDTFSAGHDAEGRPLIDVEHRGHGREDSPATAREMSAAYEFWAWEIEQRQKEKKPTMNLTDYHQDHQHATNPFYPKLLAKLQKIEAGEMTLVEYIREVEEKVKGVTNE